MPLRFLLGVGSCLAAFLAYPEGLDAQRLGVLYNVDNAASREVALLYAQRRSIPAENVIGLHLPEGAVMPPSAFSAVREAALKKLPASVQSLALVWSKPYAVGCMSITTAFAAGYKDGFCLPACARTLSNSLYDADGWLPADTVGWWPAMLLPSNDVALARALIERGLMAEGSEPPGIVYLTNTLDPARNVRAATYVEASTAMSVKLRSVQLSAPVVSDVPEAIGYFTGAVRVFELPRILFRPGALADHLTSSGGVLDGTQQMTAIAWISQGASASYGTVSEPCNLLEKFPNIGVLFAHYVRGETALEAYWKSVKMPGQGLFIGDPLARPFAAQRP